MTSSSPPNDANCPSKMSVRARRALFEKARTTLHVSEAVVANSLNGPSTRSNPKNTQNSCTTGSRQPLGFLSPNYKPRRISRKGDIDKESHLTIQISGLRQQINEFETETNNLDVTDDAAATAVIGDQSFIQNLQPNEQLIQLNKKLLHIQAGLVEIEGERCHLVSKAKQLEQEKESLSKQLFHREKEIEALQKRCMHAAEQSKESMTLRSTNNILSHQVVELKTMLAETNEEKGIIAALKLQLQESQTVRDDLKRQLESAQRDFSCVCDDLNKCLATVDELKAAKTDWENEKRLIQQQVDLQLEQQRLDHIKATADLRDELKVRELKVQDLDRLLQDKVGSIQHLRDQLSQVESAQADTLNQMAHEYNRKLQDVQNDFRHQLTQKMEHDMHNEMSALQGKLRQKTSEIEALRADVSVHMQELMVATSEVQKMQEDSAMLDCLFRDIEALELERFELSETLHEKDIEIAELSAEILKLEIEKELSEQDSVKLRELKNAYDLAKQDCASSDERLSQVTEACRHLESEILRINTENDQAVARIRADFDATINDMQLKLQHAEDLLHFNHKNHSDIVDSKDETIAKLEDQIDSIMCSYQEELSSLRKEFEKSSLAWKVKEDELRSLFHKDLSEKELLLSSLRVEMKHASEVSNAKEAELQKKLEGAHARVMNLMSKCANLESLTVQQAAHHESEVSKLIISKTDLLKEKEELQCIIIEQAQRLDDFKVSERKSIIRADTKISQLEEQIRQLKATTSDMENISLMCSREHAFEKECLQQTLSELQSKLESSKNSIEQYEEILQESREQLSKQQSAFDSERVNLEQKLKQNEEKVADLEKESATSSCVKQTLSCLQTEVKVLEEKNRQLQESFENSAENSAKEYKVTIEKMSDTIDNLRRERDFSKMSLLSCERKLEEEKSEREMLFRRYNDLQQSEHSLQNERRSLTERLEEVQSERDKLELVLEQETNQTRANDDALREQLKSTEKTLINYEEQMAQLEAALEERTKVISDITSSAKQLQIKVDRSDQDYKTLEERSSLLQIRCLDREDELKRLRIEWQHKEDDYLEEIHKERNARDILEADLAATIARLDAAKVESRDLSELEKENLALKDKIRRQEAYLQRKIEQDKAVRERLLSGSLVKTATVMKTPARGGTQQRVPKSSAASSQSTRSTVPDTESINLFDNTDLDSLLAD